MSTVDAPRSFDARHDSSESRYVLDETGPADLGGELDRALVRTALFGEPAPQIDRFALEGRLGEGASSIVYAAWDPKLERRVAVKIFVRASASARELVLKEARALAKLSHRNVVTVFDAGEWKELAFLAMELVRGTTLARWQAEPRRTAAERIAAYVQAGRGLEAAHRAGLVHRDFKPANVMVASDGRVVVTDFGLAGAVTSEADLAPPSQMPEGSVRTSFPMLGTPAYVAPEQRAGATPHPAADIYSFSLSLCEALCGCHPTLRPRPGWRRVLGRHVPPRAYAALLAGLAEQPEARGASLTPLLDALEAVPPRRRVRRTTLAAAGIATALVAAGLVAVREWPRHSDRIGPARTYKPPTARAPAHQIVARRVDAVLAAQPDPRGASEIAATRALLLEPLATELPCAWPSTPDTSTLGDGYAAAIDGRGVVHACALGSGEISRVFTGARCVTVGEAGLLGVTDLEGHPHVLRYRDGAWREIPVPDADRVVAAAPGMVAICQFSLWPLPDGSARFAPYLHSDRAGRIEAMETEPLGWLADRVAATARIAPPLPTKQPKTGIRMSPGGDRVVAVPYHGPIFWWQPGATRWEQEPLHSDPPRADRFQLSPSGARALVLDSAGSMEVRTLGGGPAWWLTSGPLRDAIFHGETAIIGIDIAHRVWRWDLARQRQRLVAIHDGEVWSVAANAEVLVTGSEDGTAQVIDRRTGALRARFDTHQQIYKVLLDGESLVAAGIGGLHRWAWRTGAELPLAAGQGLVIWDVAPAPSSGDAIYLAASLRHGEIFAWGNTTRTPVFRSPSQRARSSNIALSPDRRTAAATNSIGELTVIDVATQRVVARRAAYPQVWSHRSAFDPATGSVVTVGNDGYLRTWSPPAFELSHQVRVSPGTLYDVDVHADQAVIAAKDGSVALVDLARGELVRRYAFHESAVLTARFSPDGKWFVTGDKTGRGCLWRTGETACHTPLETHDPAGIVHAMFTDDGEIITSAEDGTVRAWRPTYDAPIEALRAELARYGSRR